MPLMLITPQMLSVAFFSLYRRVADEAPVGVWRNRRLDLLVLALLGLEFFNVPLPLLLKFVSVPHNGFVFLFCQENRLTQRNPMIIDWELGYYNRLLEGGLVGWRRIVGQSCEVKSIVKLVQGRTLEVLWFVSWWKYYRVWEFLRINW